MDGRVKPGNDVKGSATAKRLPKNTAIMMPATPGNIA
jgi:hypothetical protein